MPSGKTVVAGIGNVLLKDEGIGVHVVREMARMNLPDRVELVDIGTSTLDLLAYIEDAEKLVIVDALEGGEEPGAIYRFKPEELILKEKTPGSAHQLGPMDTLRMAKRLGRQPRTVIIGVEPAAIDWGMDLSPNLGRRMTAIVEAVMREL